MNTNISKEKREQLIKKITEVKKFLEDSADDKNKRHLLSYIAEIENDIFAKKYGLVFEEHEEGIDKKLKDNIPVLSEEKELFINNGKNINFLIEGDNLASIELLKKTHSGMIDLIYIDPPYNRGDNDFVYDDKYVDKEDTFKHSKWLSFMEKRLLLSKELLSKSGVILIHIDENEVFNLVPLMNEIYGEKNDLGMIVWNKMNPKGDPKGVSTMHEYVVCFAKNKSEFANLENTCMRNKPNAEKIIKKANSLFKLLGKKRIPEEIKKVVKPFNYSKALLKEFEVEYTLELINEEFKGWLSQQPFSKGEKAYKFIDENGEVYRGVSMAWPNKKKAPEDYFIPLIHPDTKKPCPVPRRGWRNPPSTMKKLLDGKRILFGDDETKQPERKYFLKENMAENTPSIYASAASDDDFFLEEGLNFEYAKPIDTLQYFITSIHPNAKMIVDFFAGSGSTGHAVMELNKKDNGSRKFILGTNNQNNICRETTYKRLKNVIEKEGYSESLKYYKVDFIEITDKLYYEYADELLRHVKELVELENGINFSETEEISIILTEEELEEFTNNKEKLAECKTLYLGHDVLTTGQQDYLFKSNKIKVNVIPNYYYKEVRG
ncbi:site-specific DNA-methyltransferase [Rossellomorea oryzaecorticis]|uniref:Site-specific DNA-methyltransferase n=1 Tax=Rossellomorea oryzaecorticis TaxID=1396505 RepID=A0ABU9K7M2_9BACI